MTETAALEQAMEAGNDALARGAWAEARISFERALEAGEAPDALEGLSWAAWWLDDAETVFDARERAYHLYAKANDDSSAARMATWLAADELDFRGASAVARGWLRRAGRLLDPVEPGPDHGWLAFHEGYVAYAGGDSVAASKLAARASEIGSRFGVPDLEMLGLALRGTVLVASAEVEEGMTCLDEATATALAGEARIPISAAWACCFLVTACEAVRDYRRASEWCERIAEFADRYDSRYMLGFCRGHYGMIHIREGRWKEAEAQLASAAEAYSRSRPAFVGDVLAALAELRRRQGRAEEAAKLLDDAEGHPAGLLCRAELALDGGEPARAADLAERYLRVPDRTKLGRGPALEILVRARAARGDLERAATALDGLREVARLVGTEPLGASAALAGGVLAGAEGDHDRARTLLEDAVDLFQRGGTPFEAAQARIELATALTALGRAGAAQQEAARALDRLVGLGAELEARRARRVLASLARGGDGRSAGPAVTPREREVLALLVEGLTNREIAERLMVSEHTVHRHVTNILRKLELPSRTAAAAHAVRAGLLDERSE